MIYWLYRTTHGHVWFFGIVATTIWAGQKAIFRSNAHSLYKCARISQAAIITPGNRFGHMKDRYPISLESMSKSTDIRPTKYDLEVRFEEVISDTQKSIISVQQLGKNALEWFMDRSKMDAEVGVGV